MATQKQDGTAPKRGVTADAILAILATFVVTATVFVGMAFAYGNGTWPTPHGQTAWVVDVTRATAPLAALVGASAAVAISVRRQKSIEENTRLTAENIAIATENAGLAARNVELAIQLADRDVERALRERFTSVSDQLGSPSPTVRLAGVHAIAALADDWLERGNHLEVQVNIDILCAYLRSPTSKTTAEELGVGEAEVRGAIVKTIAQHLRGAPVSITGLTVSAAQSAPSWSGHDFDFSAAVFPLVADFSHCDFRGSTNFDRCKFVLGVSFAHAQFSAPMTFEEVLFTNADMGGLRAENMLRFAHCTFTGPTLNTETTSFAHGNFSAPITFKDCTFQDGADFTASQVALSLIIDDCSFAEKTQFLSVIVGEYGTIYIDSCWFEKVDFSGMLVGGTVGISNLRLPAGTSFDYSEITGVMTLSNIEGLSEASFHDVSVSGELRGGPAGRG